jgi:hypothetical protein
MLAGTRAAAGPRDETRFSRQWKDAGVREEFDVLGFESPEQLGATFLGDAAFLEEWTRGVPPLVDDHPDRLSSTVVLEPAQEYYEVMDAGAARDRFSQSPWIRRIWPASLVDRTLPYFESHAVLTAQLQRRLAPGAVTRWLHWSLTLTSGEYLPLLLLGTDGDAQRLAEGKAEEREHDPQLRFELAKGALARRDYTGAAARLAELPAGGAQADQVAVLRVLALHLAGEREEAQLLAQTLRPASPGIEAAKVWAFLDELLGSPPA